MSRQEKTILTVFALALVLSLLALLLWQETGSDEPEILHLSVLLDGSEETAWRNFRRGADAAAVEYNVDLRYVYRYENPGQVGQLQAMEAELASGAEAVAVAPLDAEALTEYLRNHSVLQPVVAMGSEVHDEAIAGCVAVDSRAQASLLAGAIVDSGARHCRIYLRTGCGELPAAAGGAYGGPGGDGHRYFGVRFFRLGARYSSGGFGRRYFGGLGRKATGGSPSVRNGCQRLGAGAFGSRPYLRLGGGE